MAKMQPIFIIGPPRSGTTLLTRLLAGAPGVLGLSEPFHLHAILHRWALRGFFWDFQRRNKLARVPIPHKCTEMHFLDYLQNMALANNLRRVVIKEVYKEPMLPDPFRNFEQLDRFASNEWPLIAITRHPCDAAASTLGLLHHLFGRHRGCIIRWLWPNTPRFRDDDDIVQWAARNWACFAAWTRERRLYTVRYEDLVARMPEILPDICRYAGLSFDKNLLNHHLHRPAAFGGIGDPIVLMQKDRPVHDRSIGRGRSLTRRQYQTVLDECAEQAVYFGYRLRDNGHAVQPFGATPALQQVARAKSVTRV